MTVCHQALQTSRTYHDYSGPCPVNPEGTHTWGNCFQNPRMLEIKAAEYNYMNIDTVVDKLMHFTTMQRSC